MGGAAGSSVVGLCGGGVSGELCGGSCLRGAVCVGQAVFGDCVGGTVWSIHACTRHSSNLQDSCLLLTLVFDLNHVRLRYGTLPYRLVVRRMRLYVALKYASNKGYALNKQSYCTTSSVY